MSCLLPHEEFSPPGIPVMTYTNRSDFFDKRIWPQLKDKCIKSFKYQNFETCENPKISFLDPSFFTKDTPLSL